MKSSQVIALLFVLIPFKSFADSVDFLIGDVHPPERKWGHVSLSVSSANRKQVFDFGRYARMWDMDLEGDPILRVWKSEQEQLAYLKSEGGTVARIHFEATPGQTAAIFAHYDALLAGASVQSKNSELTAYNLPGKPFHAMDYNCAIMARQAFAAGFSGYDVNDRSYSHAEGLHGPLRVMAKNFKDYSSDSRTWSKIWWPADLRILLEDKYVKHGDATEQLYHN